MPGMGGTGWEVIHFFSLMVCRRCVSFLRWCWTLMGVEMTALRGEVK